MEMASPQVLITPSLMENYFKKGDVSQFPEKWTEGKLLFTTLSGSPLLLFSTIPVTDKLKPKRGRTKTMMGIGYLEKIGLGIAMNAVNKRKKAESFVMLLEPAYTLAPKSVLNSSYNPYLVDDPEFQTGRNKTVITLPGFRGSIIQHSKLSDVHKAQNEYLKERLPTLDANITLSEIRDLKSKMVEISKLQDLAISSVATAFVYFEKLIVKVGSFF
jgi:hypothetical protein